MSGIPASKRWYACKEWLQLVLPVDEEVREACVIWSAFFKQFKKE